MSYSQVIGDSGRWKPAVNTEANMKTHRDGEDVEKSERSHTAGGKVKRCSPFGKRFGSFSKSEMQSY